MPKSENVQLIEALYAAFGKGDIATVLDGFSDQIEWVAAENSPYAVPSPYKGKQAVLENVFKRLGVEWEDFRVTPQEYLDAGGTVIALGRYSGIHHNTRRQVNAQFAHLWDIRGGKIVRYRQYVDTLQLGEAVGTVTRPATYSTAH